MRNLSVDQVLIMALPFTSSDIQKITCLNDDIIVHAEKSVFVVKHGDVEKINNIEVKFLTVLETENIICMGDGSHLELWDLNQACSERCKKIEISGGYDACCWSPKQERVVFACKSGSLRVMTLDPRNKEFTSIGEYDFHSEDVDNFVNVGWGSKETQFHGSDQKNVRSEEECKEPESEISDSLVISWRDDCTMFIVGYARMDNMKTRTFKMFSYDCEFLYENEFKPGLSDVLAWKPDGSLIISVQVLHNDQKLVFFEKNGVYKYDCLLHNNIPVRQLIWSPDCDKLTVLQKLENDKLNINHSATSLTTITLWTYSNGNWYLKQSLLFNHENQVNSVKWLDSNTMEIVTSNNILIYNWSWVISRSCPDATKSLAVVAVIDGCKLNVTNLPKQVVPPPMCSYSINVKSPINFIAFVKNSNTVCVITDNYIAWIFKLNQDSYEYISNIQLCTPCENFCEEIPLNFNHFIIENDPFTAYATHVCSEKYNLVKFDLENGLHREIIYKANFNIDNIFLLNKNELLVQVKGCIYSFEETSSFKPLICSPNKNVSIFQCELTNDYYSLALFQNNLFLNDVKVASHVSSYAICEDSVFFTTSDENRLYCYNLCKKGLCLLKNGNKIDVYSRKIPLGAIIIMVVPETRNIIFQIPRGELETIHLRSLSINEVVRLLQQGMYKKAFALMKADRIDTNLLYDINPQRFITEVEDFVKQLDDCELFDLFLMQLKNSNIIEELYSKCFINSVMLKEGKSTVDKVVDITNAFIYAAKHVNKDKYLQSVVTAYVARGTDVDLENALQELSDVKSAKDSETKVMEQNLDAIMEHMITLTAAEKLYTVSLGMDRFDLLMWIASKTQLDPLEYIPFMKELSTMEENFRKYKINFHIKRYEIALQYLLLCNNVSDELQNLISQQDLYHLIIRYVQPTNQWYKLLIIFYARYLESRDCHHQAGIMFQLGGDLKSALNSFILSYKIQEVYNILNMLKLTSTEKRNVYLRFVSKLTEQRKFKEAAFICEEYLENYEQAVELLISGKHWAEAVCVANRYNRSDIIETDIQNELVRYADDLCNYFRKQKELIEKHSTRLLALRKGMTDKLSYSHLSKMDSDIEIGATDRDIDVESLASTVTNMSVCSTSSKRSSKSKKKLERKAVNTREGGPLEHIALVRELHLIISDVYKYEIQLQELCSSMLLYVNNSYHAYNVHSQYSKLLDYITTIIPQVWCPEFLDSDEGHSAEQKCVQRDIKELEHKYRYPPKLAVPDWKIHCLV